MSKDKRLYEGPTIDQIYARQAGKCWLEAEFDEIEGKKVFGDLFCVGEDARFPTRAMLNPTKECVKCWVDFMYFILENPDEEKVTE